MKIAKKRSFGAKSQLADAINQKSEVVWRLTDAIRQPSVVKSQQHEAINQKEDGINQPAEAVWRPADVIS